ncbi:hypothetical protein J2N86_10785 [Legionella lytica]|uniref:Transmembrane protein n=1 Tax=Legionella lytica TaxID=96232 RepID=A0ABY4Y6C0_9GAMM|nr:hypothetical protein [Legionella lytica]USQ13170.1 hypothetical protein J2N86_10785 [Legionella lytica]
MEVEQEKNQVLSSEENLNHNQNAKIIKTCNEEHPTDAKIRRIKDCLLFFIVLIMVLGVFYFCVLAIFNVRSLDYEKEWARIIITAIISALLGFIIGKSSK